MVFLVFLNANVLAQDTGRGSLWSSTSNLSFGSENNVGNSGILFKQEMGKKISSGFMLSAHISIFHSLPKINKEPSGDKSQFSAFWTGLNINHLTRFGAEKNFVKLSGGLFYANTTLTYVGVSSYIPDQTGNLILVERMVRDYNSRLGYYVGISGGRQISDKVSLGLILDIYSMEIFAEVTTLGVLATIRID